jgi:hypothetical protein
VAEEWFDSYWKEKVIARRAKRKGWKAPPRSANTYGYVYLLAHTGFKVLKVGYTTRRPDFAVGRIAQHIDQGFEKVKIVRFETFEEAELLERDVLWLWTKHQVRKKLSGLEMPQGGGTEVAEDNPLSRSIFNKAVAAKRRGDDPRLVVAPKSNSKSGGKASANPLPRIRSLLVGQQIVGTTSYSSSNEVRALKGQLVDVWIVRNQRNPYDSNALEVHTTFGMIGHVPKAVSAALAPLVKQLPDGLTAQIRVPANGLGNLCIEKVSKRKI